VHEGRELPSSHAAIYQLPTKTPAATFPTRLVVRIASTTRLLLNRSFLPTSWPLASYLVTTTGLLLGYYLITSRQLSKRCRPIAPNFSSRRDAMRPGGRIIGYFHEDVKSLLRLPLWACAGARLGPEPTATRPPLDGSTARFRPDSTPNRPTPDLFRTLADACPSTCALS
jgi:hypothetical protein